MFYFYLTSVGFEHSLYHESFLPSLLCSWLNLLSPLAQLLERCYHQCVAHHVLKWMSYHRTIGAFLTTERAHSQSFLLYIYIYIYNIYTVYICIYKYGTYIIYIVYINVYMYICIYKYGTYIIYIVYINVYMYIYNMCKWEFI